MTAIVRELLRRDVFKVAAAYAVVAWLLVQIAAVVLEAFELPNWVMQAFLVLVAIGFPVTVALAWIYDLTPAGVKRTLSVLSVIGMVIAGGLAASALIGRDRAVIAQAVAEREASTSAEVTDFLVSIFETSDPYSNVRAADEVAARELLDRGSERIFDELGSQPRVQAQLLNTMGLVYAGLGDYVKAEELLDNAVAIRRDLGDRADIGESLYSLGKTLHRAGKYPEAQTALEDALEIQKAEFGDTSPEVARTLNQLALGQASQSHFDEARRLQQEAIDIRRGLEDSDPIELALAMNSLGEVLFAVGEYDQAADAFGEAVELFGDREPGQYAISLANLAAMHMISGRFATAKELHADALAAKRRVFQAGHVEIAYSLANLAWLLRQEGDFELAERHYLEAIDIFRETYGNDHGNVGVLLASLAQVHSYAGRLERAEALFKEALPLITATFGEDSIRVSETLNGIGELQIAQGNLSGAAKSFSRVIEIADTLDNDQELPVALAGYATLEDTPLSAEERQAYFERAIETLSSRSQVHRLATAKLRYARFLRLEGQDRRAFALYQDAIQEQSTFMRPDHPAYLAAQEEFKNGFDLDAVVRFSETSQ